MVKLKLEDERYWEKLINQSLVRFLLLKALRTKEYYGYALARVIAQYSEGLSTPTQSTLYPALAALLKGGYIRVKTQTVQGRERKIYYITEGGKEAFRVAARVWGKLIPLLRKASIL